MGDAKSWLRSHREPGVRQLAQLVGVQTGRGPPSTEQLSGALLEAMRRNNPKLLVQLLDRALSRLPGTLVEDSLTAAWRRAHAQGLPLSKEVRQCAVGNMVNLRYDLTRQKKKKGKPLGWSAVWGLVDRLQADSKKLLAMLGRNVEEVDEVVELARRTALGIRAGKRYFYGAYGEVPWEEMEYLVALFVEAQTLSLSFAFVLASAETVNTHLKYFLEKLQELRSRCHNKTDREDTMKKIKRLPGGERGEKMAKLVKTDKSLAGLVEDVALHRDWRSLQEIWKALEAAIKALGLSSEDWEQWGWLALRRGLFLAGEKMKNSWISPNLSGRYTRLLELMAPEGVLKVLRKGIRDTQAHGGAAAAELTMTREERERLQEELERVLRTVRALLREAEVDLVTKTRERTRLSHREVSRILRSVAREGGNDSIDNLINARVMEVLEKATVGNNGNELDVIRRTLNSKSHIESIIDILLNCDSRTRNVIAHTDEIYAYARQHGPQCCTTIHRLLDWKSSENLSSLKDDMLKGVDSSTKAARPTQYSAVTRALKHIANVADIDVKVRYYAVEGGLQALASLWSKEDDNAPPLLDYHAPALFGRRLRDYLHHGDSIMNICSRATAASTPIVSDELLALWVLIRDDLISGQQGAEPRAADDVGADEVLLLVQRKDDMFNKARLGDLAGLQRAAESGVDISSRDCWGRTLLHAAAEAGSDHVVKWLLELGTDAVDPRAKDGEGRSALHCAASGEVAKLLLQPCKQVEWDAAGYTPLHTAALSGREDVIRVLLPHQDLIADSTGKTPLQLAALGGHEAAVRLLLEAGAQYRAGKQGLTPLYTAAQSGSAPTVRLLLYPPPPLLPQASDDDCWGAAGDAGGHRHVEAFRTLVAELQQRGALKDCPAARQAVRRVARGGSGEVAGELLQRWPQAVRLELDDRGRTVLSGAAVYGNAGLVRALLARGADPLHRDKNSRTALHGAAQNGHVEVISALWDFTKGEATGREELRRMWSGQGEPTPPLCLAAKNGHLPAVQRLVELGADMNTGSLEQELAHATPLWSAARYGRAEVVGWLLEEGAHLYHPGAASTPLHPAAMLGHLDVVQLLVPSSVPTKAQRDVRLDLLQHADPGGQTALHGSVFSGSQLVVELLLRRELDLLLPHHDIMVKKGESAVWKSLNVYKEDDYQRTPLHWCVVLDAPPGVFDALLKHMEDERVMRLGGKDVSAVCRIVQDALDMVEKCRALSVEVLGHTPNSDRMKKQLSESLQRLRERERASAVPTASGAGSAQPE